MNEFILIQIVTRSNLTTNSELKELMFCSLNYFCRVILIINYIPASFLVFSTSFRISSRLSDRYAVISLSIEFL